MKVTRVKLNTISPTRRVRNPLFSIIITVITISIVCAIAISAISPSKVKLDAKGYQYGIDISEHNTNPPLDSLQADGKSFAMIRLGYHDKLDKNFWANVKSAHKNKVYYGVYLYSYAKTQAEAEIEANFTLETLKKLGKYSKYMVLPVAYDIEDKQLTEIEMSELTRHITIFCEEIKAEGYTPMVYSNHDWFTRRIDLDKLIKSKYKLWYAYYPNGKPNLKEPITIGKTGVVPDMWQYARGSKDYHYIDLNVIYDIKKLCKN